MFLKAFLVFNCLVLYATSAPTSVPISEGKLGKTEIEILLWDIIPKMNCSNKFVRAVNFTRLNNLCTTSQETFCKINKALNDSSCTEPHMGDFHRLSNQIQGNANCTLVANDVRIKMNTFLKNLQNYIKSFRDCCLKK